MSFEMAATGSPKKAFNNWHDKGNFMQTSIAIGNHQFNQQVDSVVRLVQRIIGQGVVRFSVGRTNDLDRRRRDLGASDLIPLLQTGSATEALQMESLLRQHFGGHPKYAQTSRQLSGFVPPDAIQTVFLAAWYR